MEKTFLMKVVEVRLYCDECNEPMEYHGEITKAYMSYDYVYRCPKCGCTHRTERKYPYTEYVSTNTPVMVNKN